MYRVELYARVRRACRVEGMSTREASRVFGVDVNQRPNLTPYRRAILTP